MYTKEGRLGVNMTAGYVCVCAKTFLYSTSLQYGRKRSSNGNSSQRGLWIIFRKRDIVSGKAKCFLSL